MCFLDFLNALVKMKFNSAFHRFKSIAIIEGISYLVLLGFAMPMKYIAHQPLFVKYFGWLHGLLFVLFGIFLLEVWIKEKWSFGRALIAFIASLIPFGTFWFDKKYMREVN